MILADRDSTVALELLNALVHVPSLEDTSIVLQLLEHAKCDRGFTTELDSLTRANLGAGFARAAETHRLDDRGAAALNRVTGTCQL